MLSRKITYSRHSRLTFLADTASPTWGMPRLTTPTNRRYQVCFSQTKHMRANRAWTGTTLMLNTFLLHNLSSTRSAFTPQHDLTCADRQNHAGLLHRIKNSILPASLRHISSLLSILWSCLAFFHWVGLLYHTCHGLLAKEQRRSQRKRAKYVQV